MKNRAILPDLPGIYGLVFFLILVGLSGTNALQCGDTYWHIKVGQLILERGELLRSDIFSHTAFGKPWIAHEWLSEVLMAAAFNFAGLPGLTLVFFLVATLAFTLICMVARELTDDWSTSIAAALALPLVWTHLLVRPHLFTWLFGALTIYLLIRQKRSLWLLPLITALWANLHGGFVLGLVMQGAFWVGSLLDAWPRPAWSSWQQWLRNHSRASAILLLSFLASGLNPFGYELLLFPLTVGKPVFLREIVEWASPDMQQHWYLRLWIVALLILASIRFRKTEWGWRLLVLFLVYQALGHARHMSVAALFTLPWVATAIHEVKIAALQRTWGGRQLLLSRCSGPVITTVIFVMLFLASHNQTTIWRQFAASHFTQPSTFSPQLIEYLKKGYPGERLFNEYSMGGFFLFALSPPPKVFIDGRADMYGEEIFEDYLKIVKLTPDFEKLLEKYRIDWIVFPKEHHLIRYLIRTPDWKQIYTDDQLAIIVTQKNSELISASVYMHKEDQSEPALSRP